MRFICLVLALITSGCSNSVEQSLCGDERVVEAHELKGYENLEDGLKCAKALDRPVLLVFTGYAISDRTFSRRILADTEVLNELKTDYVPVILYVDDKDELSKEEQYSVNRKGEKRIIRTVGQHNSELQMTRFWTSSQPCYAVLSPDNQLLGEPFGYTPSPSEFLANLRKRTEK